MNLTLTILNTRDYNLGGSPHGSKGEKAPPELGGQEPTSIFEDFITQQNAQLLGAVDDKVNHWGNKIQTKLE